jgi:hypothetical protein
MPINIPSANINNPIARNFVKQMASDGFLPVIALEAFVEGGRTYQAYKKGGFDEARERITEEFSGAVFWLGGVSALNAVFEKLGQKILKLPNINVDIASDGLRKPLDNFLEQETTKNGAKILEKTMAKFKFIKVISSVVIANAFIGFILPKINQAITRSYHKNKKETPQTLQTQQNLPKTNNSGDSFIQRPVISSFVNPTTDDKKKKDISFGLNLLSVANKFENDRNYKLLSVDAGTASGRAFSARNNDERAEILFRDLSSIYFYMFNMQNMNNWLNRLEQKGNPTRLDPVSAEFTTTYMNNYLKTKPDKKVHFDKFAEEFLGKNEEIPAVLKEKFTGENIKIISLETFKNELKDLVPESNIFEYELRANEMSTLQPQIKGQSILTEGQVKAILDGGHINNPKFLKEFYKNRFGSTFMDKYKFVAQKDLDAYKKEMVDYVKSIIETAKKTPTGEITEQILSKASSKNLKMNALNWGAGFVTSALFLSTLIPKMQYKIRKWRTGSEEFPGTAQFRQEENNKQLA